LKEIQRFALPNRSFPFKTQKADDLFAEATLNLRLLCMHTVL